MSAPITRFPSTAQLLWKTHTFNPVAEVLSGMVWVIFHSWPLLPGLLAKAFFDLLQGNPTAPLSLSSIILILLGLSAVRCGLVLCGVGVGWFAGFGVHALLQRNVLASLFKQPGAKALPSSVGEALSTLRDDVVAMSGSGVVFDSLGFLIFAGGGLLILLRVNALLTLLVLVPIIAVIWLAHVLRTRLQYVREQSRSSGARVTGAIGDIFAATQAIQVAGAVTPVVAHLKSLGERRRQAALRDRFVEVSINALFDNTANLGAGLTLLIAASSMRAGTFSLGDFALFSTDLMQVSAMTGFLGFLVSTYQQLNVSFRRGVALMQPKQALDLVEHHSIYVRDVLPEVPQIALPIDERLHTLEVRHLSVQLGDNGAGLYDVSFMLPRKSFTVVTGRVGSGKTTLLRATLGLLEREAGEIWWNGQRIEDPSAFFVPPRSAYTPQVPALLSGTLRENLRLGLALEEADLLRAIEITQLNRDIATFEHGLDAMIGVRGMKLSGGQIQRVAAARMLARTPELLVFDDLSSALDIETELALWQRVFALNVTCLVVSHRPAVLAHADQVLVMEQGRLSSSLY